MKEEALIEKAIQWAKRKGFSAIRANHDDYEKPGAFRRVGEDDPIIPDLTGKKFGAKNYVEVALKSDEVQNKVSKWKLLSSLAAAKGGNLFLLAPRGHKAFTEKLVREYSLPAEVVSL